MESMYAAIVDVLKRNFANKLRLCRRAPLFLRMFILILVLLGIGSTLAFNFRVRRQIAFIREIEEIGWVEIDFQGPPWIGDLLGEEATKALGVVTEVRTATLHVNGIRDDCVDQFEKFPGIRRLYLPDSGISKRGLLKISRLSNLEELVLSGTQIDDRTLVELLKSMPKLRVLFVNRTCVTDSGLDGLENLGDLESLNLAETRITDEGLSRLRRLKNLKSLSLSGNVITDVGLNEICGLARMEELYLSFTSVTDVGLKRLSGLSNLGYLDVSTCGLIRGDGVREIQAALPGLRIRRNEFGH